MKDQEMSEYTERNQAKCEFCGAPVPVIEAPVPILDEDQEAWAAAYQKRLNAARDELMSEREWVRERVKEAEEARETANRRYQDMVDVNASLKKALTKSQGYTWLWFIVTVVMCIMILS